MHYLKYVLVVYIWTEKGVVPPPMPDIHGELSVGETPCFQARVVVWGVFRPRFVITVLEDLMKPARLISKSL